MDLRYILMKELWKRVRPTTDFVRLKIHGDDMVFQLSQISKPSDNYILELWSNGIYEPETTAFFKENVKEGDIVVDAGASTGYFTLLLAKLVGLSGKVLAFEPNPETYKILKRNIQINGYKNIIAYPLALSDVEGKASFFLNHKVATLSSLLPQPWLKRVVEVETKRLDSLNLARLDFIKIDVEGADDLVLRGMRETIERNPSIRMVIEFNPIDYSKEYAFAVLGELEEFEMYPLDRHNLLCWRKE